ncbi:MAG: hypothetical protein IJ015_01535 [Ruminococcus sp.]|nr:hypothetical protein [Ruminococcus sp.]
MNINFSGYNENVVTFEIENTDVVMGTPVKMSKSGTVTACEDGESIIGVAVNVRNGYAAVQLSGYIEMPTDETFTVGMNNIVSAGATKVKSGANGKECLVVYVDNGVVGFIL